jgi:nitroreductase
MKNKAALMGILAFAFIMAAFACCASSQELISKNTETSFPLSPDLREILYYASLAPNGHNTQPWKREISADEKILRLYIDSIRLLPAADGEGRESLISLGAFLKNLTLSLGAFGYGYTLSIVDSVSISDDPLVAEIIIHDKNGTGDRAVLECMEKRHTEKSAFLNKALENSSVKRLLASAGGAALYFPKSGDSWLFVKEKTMAANELQSHSGPVREELATWLRFSDEEAKEKADGLPAEQLGLTGIIKTLYYAITDREKAADDKFAKRSVKLAKKQLENCEGFFIITGENSARSYIEAGMNMEALWLAAAGEGISLQPMSQGLEEKVIRDSINMEFPQSAPFQMIMRAGYVKNYGENNKIRRPLKDFVFIID